MGQKKASADTWSCPGRGVVSGPFPMSSEEPYEISVKILAQCKHPKDMMASMQLRGADRDLVMLQSQEHSRHLQYQRHLATTPMLQIENGFIVGGTVTAAAIARMYHC